MNLDEAQEIATKRGFPASEIAAYNRRIASAAESTCGALVGEVAQRAKDLAINGQPEVRQALADWDKTLAETNSLRKSSGAVVALDAYMRSWPAFALILPRLSVKLVTVDSDSDGGLAVP